jgi:hypothetical protein
VLAMLALNSDGSLKQEKIKALINIFRPQRDGSLSTLDFVKSVDDVVRLPEENMKRKMEFLPCGFAQKNSTLLQLACGIV